MTEATASEQANREAEQLREPLLDRAEEEVQVVAALSSPSMSSRGGCHQRGTKGSSGTIGDVEREGTPEELIGLKEIRQLWILFQCVWPALVVFFAGVELQYDRLAFFIVTMVPCLLVFILLATTKKKVAETFQCTDFVPTTLWCLLGSNEEVAQMVFAMVLFLLFLLVLLVTLLTVVLSFNHGPGVARDWLSYQLRSFCRCSKQHDYFRHLEEVHMEKLQEQEAMQQELLERQRAHLAYLEEMAQKIPPKRPTWIMPVLAVLGVWQLAFLFYAGYGLIPPGPPETVEEIQSITSVGNPSP